MNNLVKIKSKRAERWIKDNWVVSAIDLTYDRDKCLVLLKLPIELGPRETYSAYSAYSVAVYPILKSKYNLGNALEPFAMIDMYSSYGCFAAPGHTDVTICGLKILLKDIGIKVSIRKIQKYKDTFYRRTTFAIYPKSNADYAFFSLYFCDDITNTLSDQFASLHGIKPKRRKNND